MGGRSGTERGAGAVVCITISSSAYLASEVTVCFTLIKSKFTGANSRLYFTALRETHGCAVPAPGT